MARPADIKVYKIDDPRLIGYTQRTRNGSTQVFYTGNDSRDWSRYQEERKTNPSADMHDKADTIYIEPPEVHYYAELIDGEWWWMNGCAECNGRTRDWMTYVECTKHNVCCDCGIPRAQLIETPWAGRQGWRCKPCQIKLDQAIRQAALEAFAEHDYDDSDFKRTDTIICPHCASSYISDYVEDAGDKTCEICGGSFHVELETSVVYTTRIVGKRVTL